jgi:hypothetical protein
MDAHHGDNDLPIVVGSARNRGALLFCLLSFLLGEQKKSKCAARMLCRKVMEDNVVMEWILKRSTSHSLWRSSPVDRPHFCLMLEIIMNVLKNRGIFSKSQGRRQRNTLATPHN